MNVRIRELAEQAGYKPLEPRAFADDLQEVFLQKFAELIIQECAELVEDYTKQRAYNTYYNAADQIRAHFGVEE